MMALVFFCLNSVFRPAYLQALAHEADGKPQPSASISREIMLHTGLTYLIHISTLQPDASLLIHYSASTIIQSNLEQRPQTVVLG